MNLSNEAAGIATQKIPIKGTALEGTCIPDPDCKLTKYRTIDGSCNNLVQTDWFTSLFVFKLFYFIYIHIIDSKADNPIQYQFQSVSMSYS